jgi:hypothetical protein
MGNVSKMAEIDKIYLFLNGLNRQIKEHVGTTEPITLEEAINTAQTFAAYHYDDNFKTVTVSNANMQKFIRSKGKTPPGQGVECFNCGKKGHLKSECRLPKKNYTRPHNNRINYKHNNNATKFGRNGYNNNTNYKQTIPTRRETI